MNRRQLLLAPPILLASSLVPSYGASGDVLAQDQILGEAWTPDNVTPYWTLRQHGVLWNGLLEDGYEVWSGLGTRDEFRAQVKDKRIGYTRFEGPSDLYHGWVIKSDSQSWAFMTKSDEPVYDRWLKSRVAVNIFQQELAGVNLRELDLKDNDNARFYMEAFDTSQNWATEELHRIHTWPLKDD